MISSFGGGGGGSSAILQPDGQLVVAGSARDSFNSFQDFTLVRYNPDGSLDPTLGIGGKVTTDFGVSDGASALVRQPDGKLVAAGSSGPIDEHNIPGPADFALARYNPDGSLDLTFGVEGKVTTKFGVSAAAFALVLQPDGKLVAFGNSIFATFENPRDDREDFLLARYNPDGSLDPTFGVGGKVATDFGGSDHSNALILQPDGQLVAAGSSTDVFALARYFGGDGQRKLVYYGLGDSVASGHGLSGGGQDPVRCNCRRSPLAYPSLVSDDLGNLLPRYESVRFSHLACSGALSEIEDSDERCDPVDLPEQVSQLLAEPFPPDQTTLVSLTIGANDFHFPREAMLGTHICESNYQTWLTEVTTRIQIQVERQLLRLLAIENLYIVLTVRHEAH